MCASLHVEPDYQATASVKWIKHLTEELKKVSNEKQLAVLFDNAEDTIESTFKDSLLSLIVAVARQCPWVKVLITSTTKIQFSQLRKIYCLHEMKPMRYTESKLMLRSIAPDVDLGAYGDVIVELSEGLPLLILMIGAEMKINLITPEQMVNLLLLSRLETLSKDCYPVEDRVADVYKNFIKRLSVVYQEYLSKLDFIPGSFNAEEAGELLDFESVAMAKQQVLRPILIRHVISYDSSSLRFNIQGILREVIQANFTIKDLPGVRANYCKVFTKVMKEIAKKMSTDEYTRAMSTFVQEQPNLRKLLGEVNNNTQESSTYPFFIEMASSCTELIEIFMPNESEQFYKGCLRLADKYGKDIDKASVYLAVGSMETYTKGDLHTGQEKYLSALNIIEKKGDTMQLATLYHKIGWNIFKQGDCTEAIRMYKKSLGISSTAGKDFESLTLQSLSNLGVAHVVLGNFDLGEKYHSSCLRRSEALQGKIHPNVGNARNRIGLLHDQRGDPKTALEFFKQGLEIKKKSKAAPISIVYSLSNVANGYNNMGMYKEAHELVDEAFAILQDQKMDMLDGFSLMYNTRGKIYSREGRLKQAAEAYGKTVEITRQVEQKSYIFMKRLVNLAEVLEGMLHL
ncbi:uncharacterized protein LOC123564985 [Mercenaria mercenaria]|uniref:uncharacterized protein LOC123564985 n=1 Tax=Mercenaria mercenaria TaxID=6596 RepID=UPI00234ED462|nr:uncharacterized protein LOC123564985 [Mercenaria mercenaria]